MTSKRNWSLLIVLSFILAVLLLGCVRPMPGDDGTLVATSPPADSGAYPAPAEPESDAQLQDAYPAEEGYPVEQGQGDQAELMQPETEEGTAGYPASEGEAETEESTETPASAGEDQTAAEESPADETAEGAAAEDQAQPNEAAETETPAAEASDDQSAEGEAAEEATADETAQEATAESESPTTGRTHTVASGETLFSIGMQYGMSWVTLAEANNMTNPDSLYVGQVLIIPDAETVEETESTGAAETEATAGEEETAQAEETTYIVQTGDTLLSISYRFGVNMMDIARENELASFDQIYAGQELIIPSDGEETASGEEADSAAGSAETAATTHVVAEGETVFTIAFQYGVTWTELVGANEITSPYTLEAGQTLIIPASE